MYFSKNEHAFIFNLSFRLLSRFNASTIHNRYFKINLIHFNLRCEEFTNFFHFSKNNSIFKCLVIYLSCRYCKYCCHAWFSVLLSGRMLMTVFLSHCFSALRLPEYTTAAGTTGREMLHQLIHYFLSIICVSSSIIIRMKKEGLSEKTMNG